MAEGTPKRQAALTQDKGVVWVTVAFAEHEHGNFLFLFSCDLA